MAEKLLSIYLNDHLAGSTLGVELSRRARSANEGTPLGEWLAELTREIEEDRATLERLMDTLGVRRDHLKNKGAWIAEKAGRLKLNGQITGYSGVDEVQARSGEWVIDAHLPSPGTPTQPPAAGYMANAYVRMRHPDYDVLRGLLDDVGRSVHVHAE